MKAFPQTIYDQHGQSLDIHTGMDLRDYFAAQAMLVVKASDYKTTAEYCYRLADKMMEARKNESN